MNHHLALALALALCTAAPAAAQTPPDTFRLREIVVTATRTPQPRDAVPAHVTVLHGEALRARGLARVADALRDAGVGSIAQIGAAGAATSVFLRGGESDYVQVLVDGVQVNEPGGAYDWAHLSTADVERIEIVRGPASVLYGSDAVVGVVQIFTRDGAGPTRLDAELGTGTGRRVGAEAAGSFLTWDGALSLGGTSAVAGRPLGWRVGAARQWSEGAYAFNNDYHNTSLSARGHYQVGAGTAIALNGRLTDQRFHYPTDGAGHVIDRNRFTDGTAQLLSVTIEQRLTGTLGAHLLLGSYRNRTGGDDPADEPGQGFSSSSARVRRDVAELRVDAALPRGFVLSAGGELERQHGRTRFESDGPFGPYRDRSRAERGNRAAYAQLVGRVASISLTGGTRVDHSDQFGDFATARLGATADLGAGLTLHGAWGTGFKEPTFFETYATGFARGNPELTPERSRSGELGVRLGTGRLRLGATAFDQRFRNLIQYTAAPPQTDAPNYFNVGAARARGLEASGSLHGERVQLEASYTLLDTEVLDDGFGADPQFQAGSTLLRRPAHQGMIRADWRVTPRLTSGLRVAAMGARADLDFTDPEAWQGRRVTLPAYTTTDLMVQYAMPLRASDASVRAGVQNLWNEAYADIYNFPRPRRMLVLGVRYGMTL